jgi:hypothetical protein
VTPKGGGGAGSTPPTKPAPTGEPMPQVGRRPSSPGLLFAVAGMWVLAGIIIWTQFNVSWKLIPAVVSVGIGLLFLRGASQTVQRHDDRADDA